MLYKGIKLKTESSVSQSWKRKELQNWGEGVGNEGNSEGQTDQISTAFTKRKKKT